MSNPYEVVVEVSQSYALVVLADNHDGAIAQAMLDAAGRTPVVESTVSLEMLGRVSKVTGYRKLAKDDPRRPPTVRN